MKQFYILCLVSSLISTSVFARETFNTMPPPVVTNFTCRGREMGFYADYEMNCRVYHNCDDHGNKFTYHCPIDTAFRQEAMVCDHAHLVKCQSVQENFSDNTEQSNSRQSTFAPFGRTQNVERKSSGYSRSFRIGQDNVPSNSVQNNNPTFVLSSSVFLRNRNVTNSPLGISKSTINAATNFPTKQFPSPTIGPISPKSITIKDSLNHFSNQDFNSDFIKPPSVRNDHFFGQTDFQKTTSKPGRTFFNFQNQENKDKSSKFISNREEMQVFTKSKNKPVMFLEPPLFESRIMSSVEFTTKSPYNFGTSNYPYMETLRSIQQESKTEKPLTTTARRPIITRPTINNNMEIPFAVLTASLKPLVPNEVEYDPYYPKLPTSTEIYYTPRNLDKNIKSSKLSTRKPLTDLHLRIPPVLPDLNSLEDLVDRRKIFYIPKSKST